jgi:hypothetical protein
VSFLGSMNKYEVIGLSASAWGGAGAGTETGEIVA